MTRGFDPTRPGVDEQFQAFTWREVQTLNTRGQVLWLVKWHLHKSGQCFASHETMAASLNLKPSRVKAALSELVSAGLLIRTRRPGFTSLLTLPDVSGEPEPGTKNDLGPGMKNRPGPGTKNDPYKKELIKNPSLNQNHVEGRSETIHAHDVLTHKEQQQARALEQAATEHRERCTRLARQIVRTVPRRMWADGVPEHLTDGSRAAGHLVDTIAELLPNRFNGLDEEVHRLLTVWSRWLWLHNRWLDNPARIKSHALIAAVLRRPVGSELHLGELCKLYGGQTKDIDAMHWCDDYGPEVPISWALDPDDFQRFEVEDISSHQAETWRAFYVKAESERLEAIEF